jgi:hypothetical protein
MKKIIIMLVVGMMLISASAFADSFEFWTIDSVKGKIADQIGIKLENEMKFGTVNGFVYDHLDFGISYDAAQWLTIGIAERYVWDFKPTAKGKVTSSFHAPHIDAKLKFKTDSFDISDNNRFQYEFSSVANPMYRNKLSIAYPIKGDSVSFAPFAAEEMFISFTSKGFYRIRAWVGSEFMFEGAKFLKTQLYFSEEFNFEKTNISRVGLDFEFSI